MKMKRFGKVAVALLITITVIAGALFYWPKEAKAAGNTPTINTWVYRSSGIWVRKIVWDTIVGADINSTFEFGGFITQIVIDNGSTDDGDISISDETGVTFYTATDPVSTSATSRDIIETESSNSNYYGGVYVFRTITVNLTDFDGESPTIYIFCKTCN